MKFERFKTFHSALELSVVESKRLIDSDEDSNQQEHLIVLVHGLFGASKNWNEFKKQFNKQFGNNKKYYIFCSSANERTKSFQGLDVCGKRLACEIQNVVDKHQFKKISFFGHSFGGVISRYVIGQEYDKQTGTIFGLKPIHYTSICSPHLGCAIKGEAVVPIAQCISSYFPFIENLTPSVVYFIYDKTGQHLYYNDDGAVEPLFSQISKDNPQNNKHYISALQSFQSRTCYGNVNFDHNVSWCNATIRTKDEAAIILEELRKNKHKGEVQIKWKGVIKADPIEKAFYMKDINENQKDLNGYVKNLNNNNLFQNQQKDRIYASQALHNLKTLPWRRIDHAWDDASWLRHICGHTMPIVVRPFIDFEGAGVVSTIVENFKELENYVQ